MAYFCVDCWNEIHNHKATSKEYKISKELLLCEGCGEYKHVVIALKEKRTFFDFLFGKD